MATWSPLESEGPGFQSQLFPGLFWASRLDSRGLRFPIYAKGRIISNSEIVLKINLIINVQCLKQTQVCSLMIILSRCLPQLPGEGGSVSVHRLHVYGKTAVLVSNAV